jgi:hypothetical protein
MSEHGNSRREGIGDNVFIYIGLGILIFVIFWFAGKEHITSGAFYLLKAEINAIYSILRDIGVHSDSLSELLIKMDAIKEPQNIEPGRLVAMFAYVENYVRWFYLIPFTILVVAVIRKSRMQFNREFTGNTLIAEMSKSFPRIKPIVHLDFGQSDKERGAFTYAQSPFEWARERKIIIDHKNPGKTKETFDAVKCKREIINDVKTDVFRGVEPENMDLPRRFIFAVYGLWYMEMYDEHNNLLDRASEWFSVYIPEKEKTIERLLRKLKILKVPNKYTWTVPSNWVDKINKYCQQATKNSRVQKILDKYVFQDTILKALMEGIPKTTAAYYIWLKAINKNLFYTMHHTGLEVAFPFVKGIAYIYDEETKLANKGKRLVSKEEQRLLDKKDILTKINFDRCVSDMFWSIEKNGFMHQHDIVEYTDDEISNMMSIQTSTRRIDIDKPIWMFYETTGYRKDRQAKTIRTIIFFDPRDLEPLKEINMPNGQLTEDDKTSLEWYLINNYIHTLDVEYVKKWLSARGINEEIMMYDMLWDAQEAYQKDYIDDEYKAGQVTGMSVADIKARNKERNVNEFVPTEVRVQEIFNRIQSQLLAEFQSTEG